MDAASIQGAASVGQARLYHYPLAVAVALLGGVFGIIGAFYSEVQAGSWLLAIVIGAPIVEEMLKPSGVYLVLVRWPFLGNRQWFVAVLAALAGISFGLIESLIYVTVYAPDHSQAFFVYRFSVNVLIHGGASLIAGIGITGELIGWANGRNRLPRRSLYAFIAAMVIHGLYNATALALTYAGVLDFD